MKISVTNTWIELKKVCLECLLKTNQSEYSRINASEIELLHKAKYATEFTG